MVTFAQSPRHEISPLELHLLTMGVPVDESIPHAAMRITSIVVAALLSYVTTLPGTKACALVAKDHLPYGLLLASAHTESFFMINMWALNQIIEDRLHPQTEHEKALNNRSNQKHIQISVIIAALALAIISRTPRVYSAYEDGEDLFFLPFFNLPIPWYSLILSMHAIVLNHTLPKMYRPLQASKKKLQSIIAAHKEHLQDEPYLEKYHRENPIPMMIRSAVNQTPSKLLAYSTKALGLLLSVSLLLVMFQLDRNAVDDIDDNPWFSNIIGLCLTACSAYLVAYKSMSASHQHALSIKHLVTERNLNFTPASSCYPKTLACSKFISLIPNALGYGAIQHTCESNFSPTSSLGLQCVAIPAFFCITSSISFDVVEAIAKSIIRKHGSDRAKRLIQTDDLLARLFDAVHKTGFRNYARFLNGLEKDVREILCDKEPLNHYLKSKTVPHLSSDAFA